MPSKLIHGVTMHYQDQGGGPALVLLHGFPHDSRIWDSQIQYLSSRFRVIAPDLRGFGQSVSSDSFSMKSLADDVHDLLKNLDALPCVLGGLSMGGYIALEFAKRYPADLLGLILLDTRAEGDSAEGKESRNKMVDLVRSKGASAVAEQMLPKQLAHHTPQTQPAVAQKLREIMESQSPITIEHASLAMRDREDHSKDLPSIAVPTLIVVGELDALTSPAVAAGMQKSIHHSTMIVIKEAGHLSVMEQPQEVNRAIDQFVSRISEQNQ